MTATEKRKLDRNAKRMLEDGSNGLTSHLCVELYYALSHLYEASGGATIPLVSVKAVRQMAELVAAREHAKRALDHCED